jgi:hypothetical protein
MLTCPHREKLIDEYHHAVDTFSKSIKLLRKCNGDGYQKFADQHRVTEQARLHAENARMMLDLHRVEHGC